VPVLDYDLLVEKFRKVIKRGQESAKQSRESKKDAEKTPSEAAPQEATEVSFLTYCYVSNN